MNCPDTAHDTGVLFVPSSYIFGEGISKEKKNTTEKEDRKTA